MTGRESVAESVICLVRGAVVGAENATVAENITGLVSVNCLVISPVFIFQMVNIVMIRPVLIPILEDICLVLV
jgi:hypothetical protein